MLYYIIDLIVTFTVLLKMILFFFPVTTHGWSESETKDLPRTSPWRSGDKHWKNQGS